MSNTIAERGIGINDTDLYQQSFNASVRRQATLAYHTLYQGSLDEIIVQQTGDRSLSGRIELIVECPSQVQS